MKSFNPFYSIALYILKMNEIKKKYIKKNIECQLGVSKLGLNRNVNGIVLSSDHKQLRLCRFINSKTNSTPLPIHQIAIECMQWNGLSMN